MWISSEILGLEEQPLEMSTSRHAVLDFACINGKLRKPVTGFLAQTSLREPVKTGTSFESAPVQEQEPPAEANASRLFRKTTPQEVAERERIQTET